MLPQMSPMNWLLLFFFFTGLLMASGVKVYFLK